MTTDRGYIPYLAVDRFGRESAKKLKREKYPLNLGEGKKRETKSRRHPNLGPSPDAKQGVSVYVLQLENFESIIFSSPDAARKCEKNKKRTKRIDDLESVDSTNAENEIPSKFVDLYKIPRIKTSNTLLILTDTKEFGRKREHSL